MKGLKFYPNNKTQFPLITVMLLAVSSFVALASGMGNQLESLRSLLYSFYLEPSFLEIKDGQLWRVITPIFIHFGVLHLVMNGFVMWILGRIMEPIHGRLTFFLLIMIMAALSNTAQYLVSGPLFGGLSGVIYGLLGFVWFSGKLSDHYPLRLDPKFTLFIMAWFILCWSGLLSIIGIHIANTAHTVGLVSGIVLAFLMVKLPHYR